MINTKQRASLRALAHPLTPVVNIGKEGVTNTVVDSIRDVISNRELVKIKLLNNSGLETREVCDQICEMLNAEPIQCIGSIITIYKKSKKPNVKHIEF